MDKENVLNKYNIGVKRHCVDPLAPLHYGNQHLECEHCNPSINNCMPKKDIIEQIAEQLHIWYLEATKELNPKDYNEKAQKDYKDLTESQKYIDRYIAREVVKECNAYFEAGFNRGRQEKNSLK